MTREQASNAVDELAASGYAGPVAVYLNSVGKAFFGTRRHEWRRAPGCGRRPGVCSM